MPDPAATEDLPSPAPRAGLELLTAEEMGQADRLAIEGGIASLTLMENAGRAVADEAQAMVSPGDRVVVLCGPGNNGGDGFVAARLLRERGHPVSVALLGARDALKGDAAAMAAQWTGPVWPLSHDVTRDSALVIDALFGAGLSRPLEGIAADVATTMAAAGTRVLAVDVPSGVEGSTGAVASVAVTAERSVTFFRRKPGHLLLPGRRHCGKTRCVDIGIPADVLAAIRPRTYANAPALWLDRYPWPKLDGHKYARGHAVIVSGPSWRTGAARLAARGALRAGAGLVTIACDAGAMAVNAAHATAVMLRQIAGHDELTDMLSDKRLNAILIGPGGGVGDETRMDTLAALRSGAAVVLDADALTVLARHRSEFIAAVHGDARPVVLTPHDGEFGRMFPDLARMPKLERVRAAAAMTRSIVVLKGADTVVAAPDGRAVINENAPPTLATAGSGDVLAGVIVGLLAQRMDAFAAAAAAVWLHGACATAFGPGLISEDLPDMVPRVLAELSAMATGRTAGA